MDTANYDAQRKAVEQWVNGMNRRDLDAALEGFEEDGSWWGLDEQQQRKRYFGKAAIKEYLTPFTIDICVELTYTIKHIVGDGKVMMLEWTDVAKTVSGTVYINQGVLACTFDGGTKIKDARSYFDTQPLAPHHWAEKLA